MNQMNANEVEVQDTRTFGSDDRSILGIHNVSIRYGGANTVLQGMNAAIRQGEFVALVGASGCGKTTLLNAVAGMVPIANGRIEISGEPPRAGRNDIAYILARPALLPWLTARRNIEYGLKLSRLARHLWGDRVEKYLRAVGLDQYGDYLPNELSQGMRQRVALARAFAVERAVYLMDEPFSALDSQTKMELHNELLKLWDVSGATVLFVTHDLGEAVTLADRILVLAKNGSGVFRELPVSLERPRSALMLQTDARYHEINRSAWSALEASMK